MNTSLTQFLFLLFHILPNQQQHYHPQTSTIPSLSSSASLITSSCQIVQCWSRPSDNHPPICFHRSQHSSLPGSTNPISTVIINYFKGLSTFWILPKAGLPMIRYHQLPHRSFWTLLYKIVWILSKARLPMITYQQLLHKSFFLIRWIANDKISSSLSDGCGGQMHQGG